jgi:hypothetical protein
MQTLKPAFVRRTGNFDLRSAAARHRAAAWSQLRSGSTAIKQAAATEQGRRPALPPAGLFALPGDGAPFARSGQNDLIAGLSSCRYQVAPLNPAKCLIIRLWCQSTMRIWDCRGSTGTIVPVTVMAADVDQIHPMARQLMPVTVIEYASSPAPIAPFHRDLCPRSRSTSTICALVFRDYP